MTMNATNTIRYNVAGLDKETVSFLQSYNQGLAKSTIVESTNQVAMAQIGKVAGIETAKVYSALVTAANHSTVTIETAAAAAITAQTNHLARQITKVCSSSEFIDGKGLVSPQAKQTFKISCCRWFAGSFPGYAMDYKGNTFTAAKLADNQVISIKGRAVSAAKSQEEKDAIKHAQQIKADLLANAEQTTIQLELAVIAKEQAQNSAALAAKTVIEEKKIATALIQKAETSADLLAKQVADLTLQLERARHETSATISEYSKLKALVMSAKNLAALKATLKGNGYIAIDRHDIPCTRLQAQA